MATLSRLRVAGFNQACGSWEVEPTRPESEIFSFELDRVTIVTTLLHAEERSTNV